MEAIDDMNGMWILPATVDSITTTEHPVQQMRSGLFSFDWLLGYKGKPGMLLRNAIELYANPGIGKSTLAYYLAARVRPTGKVLIANLEPAIDVDHVAMNAGRAGFSGSIEVLPGIAKDGKARPHGQILADLGTRLKDKEVNAGILDSVGAYIPVMEDGQDDLSDVVWGKRAQELAKFSRRASNSLRLSDDPKLLFVINHVQPSMVNQYAHVTPGGTAISYLTRYRLWMRKSEDVLDSQGTWVKITAEKKTFGGVDPKCMGYVFIIPSYGVSPEMTAVFDCFEFGLATRPNGTGNVKVGEVSTKRLRDLLEIATDPDADKTIFLPFYQALLRYERENFNG